VNVAANQPHWSIVQTQHLDVAQMISMLQQGHLIWIVQLLKRAEIPDMDAVKMAPLSRKV
jgi:hypothetical protein